MIIVDELPFCHIEKPGFRHFMSVCCPRLHIPSHITVARDCLQLYLKERTKLKELSSMKCQRICVTTDTCMDKYSKNQLHVFYCSFY